jgi:hypothetical protein
MKMVRQTEALNHPGSQRQDPVCQRDPWPPDQHQIIEHQNLLGPKEHDPAEEPVLEVPAEDMAAQQGR